jgi:anti-sigma B factor antagonist
MQIEDRKIGNVLVVKPLEKRIDAFSATAFKGKMIDWITGGSNRIVLDLSEVDFIDSSGLGVIVSSLKAVGKQGGLILCGIRETVLSLFRLTRMDRVFQIVSSPEEAVKALSHG